jgi:hypothetical protein
MHGNTERSWRGTSPSHTGLSDSFGGEPRKFQRG